MLSRNSALSGDTALVFTRKFMYFVSFTSSTAKQIVANPHTLCKVSKNEVSLRWTIVSTLLRRTFKPSKPLSLLETEAGGVNCAKVSWSKLVSMKVVNEMIY